MWAPSSRVLLYTAPSGPLGSAPWRGVHLGRTWLEVGQHFHCDTSPPSTVCKNMKEKNLKGWKLKAKHFNNVLSKHSLIYLQSIPRNGKTAFLGAKRTMTLRNAFRDEVRWWGLSLATSLRVLLFDTTFSSLDNAGVATKDKNAQFEIIFCDIYYQQWQQWILRGYRNTNWGLLFIKALNSKSKKEES